MKVLPILTIFALTQGVVGELCKEPVRYCGKAFKRFSNAGRFHDLQDDKLYQCGHFKSTTSGQQGEYTWYYNEPLTVQNCDQGCVDGGAGKNDYCGGESLFIRDEKLARCADYSYAEAARNLQNSKTKLQELRATKALYRRLHSCVFLTVIRRYNGASPEYRKEAQDLFAELSDKYEKTSNEYKAEEKRVKQEGKNT